MIGESQGKIMYAAQHNEPTQNNFILLHSSAKLYMQQPGVAAIPAQWRIA